MDHGNVLLSLPEDGVRVEEVLSLDWGIPILRGCVGVRVRDRERWVPSRRARPILIVVVDWDVDRDIDLEIRVKIDPEDLARVEFSAVGLDDADAHGVEEEGEVVREEAGVNENVHPHLQLRSSLYRQLNLRHLAYFLLQEHIRKLPWPDILLVYIERLF